uniref:Uncharacterized protein n=1 Tax=viral metagenome TaxID=1070528 RepID=A0A6M3L2D1_9ZZZZ
MTKITRTPGKPKNYNLRDVRIGKTIFINKRTNIRWLCVGKIFEDDFVGVSLISEDRKIIKRIKLSSLKQLYHRENGDA